MLRRFNAAPRHHACLGIQRAFWCRIFQFRAAKLQLESQKLT